jgi:hypothetical protein
MTTRLPSPTIAQTLRIANNDADVSPRDEPNSGFRRPARQVAALSGG